MTDLNGPVSSEGATLDQRAALTPCSSNWTTTGIPAVLPGLLLTDVKHFAVSNQEADRMPVSAQVDERALHEISQAGQHRRMAAAVRSARADSAEAAAAEGDVGA
jgi:hypothetical protein